MSTKKKTQSALRAALKQEDAALAERLPDAGAAPSAGASEVKSASDAEIPPTTERAGVESSATVETATVKSKAPKMAVAKTTVSEPASAVGKKTSHKAKPAAAPEVTVPAATKKGQAKADTADADGAKKEKRDKVVRDSFSIPTSEHARLKALRVDLGKAGRLASKSEVLRAGLKLLGERSPTELLALLDTLPAVTKGKHKKH